VKNKRIGKIGGTAIEVKSTPEPWCEGIGDGVVVIASGLRGSMHGQLASFWRDNLDKGRHVIRQIEERLRQTTWVEPNRPAWIKIELMIGGKPQECNVCVATAVDDYEPHPINARRAVLAIVEEAKQRGIQRLSVPLLGAGSAGLDPATVAQLELEAIVADTPSKDEGLKLFTLLVQDHQYDATVKTATTLLRDTPGSVKWYETIKKQAGFRTIRIIEKLEGGYSGARLDICEVTDERGARLPLTVFKIGPEEIIRQEADGARLARDILGELAIEVNQTTYQLDQKFAALRMPLATGVDSGCVGMSYLSFFKESGDPHEVAGALNLMFRSSTGMYESAEMEFHKLSDIREATEQARGGNYWAEAETGFSKLILATKASQLRGGKLINLPYPIEKTIDNPFSDAGPLMEAWDLTVKVPMAKLTHGDLNPRNIIMIRNNSETGFAPRLLDFHRFGKRAALATDFARIEAGIHIKCLERQIGSRDAASELLDYVEAITGGFLLTSRPSLIGFVGADFVKAIFAIRAIRERYNGYCSMSNDYRSYWMCLCLCLLSYLRPVYDGRLSDGQRLFAVFMAANIVERRVLENS